MFYSMTYLHSVMVFYRIGRVYLGKRNQFDWLRNQDFDCRAEQQDLHKHRTNRSVNVHPCWHFDQLLLRAMCEMFEQIWVTVHRWQIQVLEYRIESKTSIPVVVMAVALHHSLILILHQNSCYHHHTQSNSFSWRTAGESEGRAVVVYSLWEDKLKLV